MSQFRRGSLLYNIVLVIAILGICLSIAMPGNVRTSISVDGRLISMDTNLAPLTLPAVVQLWGSDIGVSSESASAFKHLLLETETNVLGEFFFENITPERSYRIVPQSSNVRFDPNNFTISADVVKDFIYADQDIHDVFFSALPPPGPESPLELPATGVWNGYLKHTNIVECANLSSSTTVSLKLSLKDNDGAVIATHAVKKLNPLGTVHIILNDMPREKTSFVDHFGTYTLDALNGEDTSDWKLSCFTAFYRMAAPGSEKDVEYAFIIPVENPTRGSSSGIFNSMNPNGGTPVANWLSIFNRGDAPFSANVEVFDHKGNKNSNMSFNLRNLGAGKRLDFPLGHTVGEISGTYRIIPNDDNAPYGAFVTRYSAEEADKFNFAFTLLARSGSCYPLPLYASTRGNAGNWGEIANPTPNAVPVRIVVRDAYGKTLFKQSKTIPAFSQHHVPLHHYLDPEGLGSLHVRCRDFAPANSRILVQSLFYGQRISTGLVDWAYASQPSAKVADNNSKLALSINTFLGARNWSTFVSSRSSESQVTLRSLDIKGQENANFFTHLSPYGAGIISIHDKVGPNYFGTGFSEGMDGHSSEMLRVYPTRNGQIGYIMNIPAKLIY